MEPINTIFNRTFLKFLHFYRTISSAFIEYKNILSFEGAPISSYSSKFHRIGKYPQTLS